MTIRYFKTAERPVLKLWLKDDDGTLIDYSTGSPTFVLKIGNPGSAGLLTKSTNIAGAAGSGTDPTGTPNCTVTWTAGELNIAPGSYVLELTVTVSALDRVFTEPIEILDTIS